MAEPRELKKGALISTTEFYSRLTATVARMWLTIRLGRTLRRFAIILASTHWLGVAPIRVITQIKAPTAGRLSPLGPAGIFLLLLFLEDDGELVAVF